MTDTSSLISMTLEDISDYIERCTTFGESTEYSPQQLSNVLKSYLHTFKDEGATFYTPTEDTAVSTPLWFQRNLESNIFKLTNIVRTKLGLDKFEMKVQLTMKSEKLAIYESTFNMQFDSQVDQAILCCSAPISSLQSLAHAVSIIADQLEGSDTSDILCSSEFKYAAVSARGTFRKTTVVQIFE